MCSAGLTPVYSDGCGADVQVYFGPVKTIAYYGDGGGKVYATGVKFKQHGSSSNVQCSNWKRIGIINMKKAMGLVKPAKLNYTD